MAKIFGMKRDTENRKRLGNRKGPSFSQYITNVGPQMAKIDFYSTHLS